MTQVASIRNIAFCGHGSAGKTSLLDRLLMMSGAVSGDHSVEAGNSVLDFDEEERHHRHTIEAKLAHCLHQGVRINLLDTPGYPEFIGHTIGAMRAVETAAIVVNGLAGVEVNTRRTFLEAEKAGLGRIIIITKLDGDNLDYAALIASIQEIWGPRCVPLNVPCGIGTALKGVVNVLSPQDDSRGAMLDPEAIREPLIESIIEIDEEVLERYFDGTPPTDQEIAKLTTKSIAAGRLIPILNCSARAHVGMRELLDAIVSCAAPPSDVPRFAQRADGTEVLLSPESSAELAGQVFKTRIDPFVQKLSFVRIHSGTLKKDQTVHISSARKGVKIGPLVDVLGGHTSPIDHAGPGEIVAIAKMDELGTGASLGDFVFPPIPFPTPMVGLAVSPKNRGDDAKLSGALHKIEQEDPTFRLDHDSQTKELVMMGMSDLHLSLIRERIHRRDKLEVDTKEPKIPYRETIQGSAEGSYRHKKQSGGRGQFGEVHIRMFPLPRHVNLDEFVCKSRFPHFKTYHYDERSNFLWIDSVVGGSIPGNFLPAIEKGFKERIERGVIAGYRVQDVGVEVHFGKHHPVDSSEAAFRIAGSMAFRNVFQQAQPALLEPIVKLAITVPESHVGDVFSDMSGRRGRVSGSDSAGGDWQTVHAEAPLAEITTYARSLSSMTGGQGSYSLEFSHYDAVPANVQHDILASAKLQDEEDEET